MAAWDFSPRGEKRERRAFTAEEARELLDYCPETGIFRWKVKVMCFAGGRLPGDEAGTAKDGYRQIKIFGRQYRAHHLAWLFMTGEWPPRGVDIDHSSRDRSDNRWANLRLATRSQNNLNVEAPRSDNTSGHRGVHRNRGNGWYARITVSKRIIHLGCFDTKQEAIAARKRAEITHYPQFA